MPGHALPHQRGRGARRRRLHVGDEAALLAVAMGQHHEALQSFGVEEPGPRLACGAPQQGMGEEQPQVLHHGEPWGSPLPFPAGSEVFTLWNTQIRKEFPQNQSWECQEGHHGQSQHLNATGAFSRHHKAILDPS